MPAETPRSGDEESAGPARHRVTRLAPSPTGALHLGNARTFLINWLMARSLGWRIVLRIEDLDGPRNKPGAERAVIEILRWLGIDWDEGPFRQAHDLAAYTDAMTTLARKGLAYPSLLTRAQIEAAASAPQESARGNESRFPPELRPADLAPQKFRPDPGASWRFVTPDRSVEFSDLFAGAQRRCPIDTIGDFAVWTARGTPAYQLAVVVDDHRQGITHIVRGEDLLDSAARQTLLARALELTTIPTYCHLPLVIGPDGRRLAKRHGDSRVAHYRERGVRPQRILGLLAAWSGQAPTRAEVDLDELLARFRLDRMPRAPVIFGPEDDAWLLG